MIMNQVAVVALSASAFEDIQLEMATIQPQPRRVSFWHPMHLDEVLEHFLNSLRLKHEVAPMWIEVFKRQSLCRVLAMIYCHVICIARGSSVLKKRDAIEPL